MSFFRKNLGKSGEDLATLFLQKKGFKILGRNIRLKFGEIDILAQDNKDIVLVEVKTKTGDQYGEPVDEIDFFKKKKLWQLARALSQKYPDKNIRIDVISVKIQKEVKIEHIVNALEF
ncbi:MAG: YraN family protein [Candidatus Berkelbacteria bacterium]|nr:YraN family protein [Candidatus Berkelbacteria bacterium]